MEKNSKIQCHGVPPPFPNTLRGQITANVDGDTATSKEVESGSRSFALLPATQPSTKIGQVTWAWAEIEAGLAAGMKLNCGDASGSPKRRRRYRRPAAMVNSHDGLPARPSDPFRDLRERAGESESNPSFEYDPFSINKSLI
jgi:hypothetical protein